MSTSTPTPPTPPSALAHTRFLDDFRALWWNNWDQVHTRWMVEEGFNLRLGDIDALEARMRARWEETKRAQLRSRKLKHVEVR